MLQSILTAIRGTSHRSRDYRFFDYEAPLAVAHRGGMGCWPENTLHAFAAADDAGATCFELDVHRTADGHLVVCHDPTLDRCTNGSGAIKAMSLKAVQQFDAGYHWTQDEGNTFPFRDRGIVVPALRELFEAFPHQRYIIDNKPENPEMARELAALAVDCGVAEQVCLASFHTPNLYAIREAYPQIATSFSEAEVQAFAVFVYTGLGRLYHGPAPCFQIPARQYHLPLMTTPFTRLMGRAGIEAHLWTINDAAEMQALLEKGARGIITDYPARAVEVIHRFHESSG